MHYSLILGTPGHSGTPPLPNALVSINDAVFLAKKSQFDCRDELVTEFLFLESRSRNVGENLEELKAKVLSSIDL
jgi:hypothetical protein